MSGYFIKPVKYMPTYIWVFTVIVFALVTFLHYLPQADTTPEFAKALPMVNAFINGTCALLLITSLIAIKYKKIGLHQRLNTTAMLLSVFFLISYVIYHYLSGETKYGGENKGLYVFILLTHIAFAGLSLPAILFAFYYGLTGNIKKHRKIVKFTYPVWLYVTITGVLVYVLLSPYYPN